MLTSRSASLVAQGSGVILLAMLCVASQLILTFVGYPLFLSQAQEETKASRLDVMLHVDISIIFLVLHN